MAAKPFALSVKALIHDGQGQFLIIRRSPASKNNAGKWDFPGGKIDSAESFDAALVREIAEEVGLTVVLERVVGAAESDLPDRRVVYLLLRARVDGGDFRLSEEHDEFAWMTPSELATAELCPQFLEFVREFAADVPGNS